MDLNRIIKLMLTRIGDENRQMIDAHLNVLKTKSVAGLSTGAIYGESIMYCNSAFYGILRANPFTAYGENLVVALQTVIMATLIWKYREPAVTMPQRLLAAGVLEAGILEVGILEPGISEVRILEVGILEVGILEAPNFGGVNFGGPNFGRSEFRKV